MITYIIIGITALLGLIIFVLLLPSGKKENKGEHEFILQTNKGKKIIFTNPFDNFLVYGGANSGKTGSFGKPLLGEYIRNNFAGLIYDYKDFDLTRTAHHFVKKYNYPNPFYYISFVDMERTHRTNPINPAIIESESIFLQIIEDFLKAYQAKDAKQDEWFTGALGILKGVSVRFLNDYPQICTIPHIANFICSAGAERITQFLESSYQSRILSGAFLDAKGSPKTQSSYLSSLTACLGTLANEKKIAYVLTGNDFDFDLIEPGRPKLLAVANSYQIESLISPIIALMVSISSRRFTLNNKIPFTYFMDEATTFKIPDFEKMPSVLREYKCSFTFLTQSASKLEKLYGKLDRSSVESNFSNQFYGRTKDVEALKTYPLIFGKEERKRISRTLGKNAKGGENKSHTTSTQKEERFDTRFFTELQTGEFIGTAAHCNYKDFHFKMKKYDEPEEPLPIIRAVLPSEIEENYLQIRKDIENL